MTYTNIKLPMETLYQFTYEDICSVIRAVAGHKCDQIINASTGYSGEGCWEEGDIVYVSNGLGYSLAYDFMEYGKDEWRIFRYASDRQPGFDE